jgi:hypothetical protein
MTRGRVPLSRKAVLRGGFFYAICKGCGARAGQVLFLCIRGLPDIDSCTYGMFLCPSSISLMNLKENEFFTVRWNREK